MGISPKAGIIGVIRNPSEYQVLGRLRGRKKPLGRIPQGFASDLLKKYHRTTGLARGSLFYLALFGRAGHLTRNIHRSYNFSIAINSRIFLSISRIGRPDLLRSGEKYPVDHVAYSKGSSKCMGLQGPPSRFKIPTARVWIERLLGPGTEYGDSPASQWRPFRPIHPDPAQVHRKFTSDKPGNFTTYASLRMSKLGILGPVVRASSASLAGPDSTAISLLSGSNLALYPAFRMDLSNSLHRQEAAIRFPAVPYAAKTSGVIGSQSNWMCNVTAVRDSTRVLRPVSHHRATHEIVHIPSSSSEIQQRFKRSRTRVSTAPFRVQENRLVAYYTTPALKRVPFFRVSKLTDCIPVFSAILPAVEIRKKGTRFCSYAQILLGVVEDRLGVEAAVEYYTRTTNVPGLRPVSFGKPLGAGMNVLFLRHGPGSSWPVASWVKESQYDITGYTTTVVRPVMRFASSISSTGSMLSGKSTQTLRPVSYKSQDSGKTVHVLGSSFETRHRFRPSRAGVRTFPFRVRADHVEVDAARSGTPILDVRPGRIRTNRSHSLAIDRLLQGFNRGQIAPKWIFAPDYALKLEKRLPIARGEVNNYIRTDVAGESRDAFAPESRSVSSGKPLRAGMSVLFPRHDPGSSWPVIPVMHGPHKILTGSGGLFVRPITPQKNISSTAQLLPDVQPKKETKDVIPREDNAFAAHRIGTGRDAGSQSKSYATTYIHNTYQSPAGIRKTEILHKLHTKTTSQRMLRNIELINNHYVRRVMGQKPGEDGRHSRFFPQEGHGFPWMPVSRSRDRGLEMKCVPLQLPVASSSMKQHTKEEAGTAPVQGSLRVKGPEMSGTLPVPEVDVHSLANRVYGIIVERVKRELELRGR